MNVACVVLRGSLIVRDPYNKAVGVRIPEGFVVGLVRNPDTRGSVSHLYKGTFSDPGLPMCRYGWNRGDYYSIWRGNVGGRGICKICLKRAHEGLDGIECPEK